MGLPAVFIQKIKSSHKIVFFTGAGISTESGVPDFRSPGGIWTKYEPVYYEDFVTSYKARMRYWTMKKETHALYKNVKPNTGHQAITTFQNKGKLLGLITQNIDGLHTLAGVSEDKIIEIHGTDRKVKCIRCGFTEDAGPVFDTLPEDFTPPLCPQCEGNYKPATISFGQAMPMDKIQVAQDLCEKCEVFIVLGSSLQVHPAASLPAIAKRYGAYLAIVNRDETPLDGIADFVSHAEIGRFMQQLVQEI